MNNNLWRLLLLPLLGFFLLGCGPLEESATYSHENAVATLEETAIIEGEPYDTPMEVAFYLEAYDELPPNYLTKAEARELGWVSSEGNLWDVAPGASIGGDYFGNFEGLLPENDYREADIEYEGGYRNAKRLVYSNDGLYYYTDDHYESFEEVEVGEDE
jgi:hypothetical protein